MPAGSILICCSSIAIFADCDSTISSTLRTARNASSDAFSSSACRFAFFSASTPVTCWLRVSWSWPTKNMASFISARSPLFRYACVSEGSALPNFSSALFTLSGDTSLPPFASMSAPPWMKNVFPIHISASHA